MLRVSTLLCLTAFLISSIAFGDTVPIGYVSWDVTSPGASGEFDIFNGTGPNSSGDTTFPVSTPVNLSSLSLTIDFSNGSSVTEPSSYFTLAPDGLSYNGSPIGIGGASPQPTTATLTGMFSPTTITYCIDNASPCDTSTETINPTFSATILPSSPPDLADGDLAIIYATEAGSATVPEPAYVSWMLLGMLVCFGISRRLHAREILRKLAGLLRTAALPLVLVVACSLLIPAAQAAVKQGTDTSPSSGTVGTNVNVTVTTGWPAGDTTPANITVTWASTCGGATVASDNANSLVKILPGSERVDVTIPASLVAGNYYVQVSDSAPSDTDFTSSNCSFVAVTGSSRSLEACVPASSLGVVAPLTGPAPVWAYVPNGAWCCGTTGFEIVQVEAGGGPAVAPVTEATGDTVNSCAGNPATGEAVCVSNDTNVYTVSAPPANTITTLTSSANDFAGFSGGECENCGVAINSNTNQAVITMGYTPSPSASALQVLNLSTNTFGAPFPLAHEVSENIVVDIPDSLILSADEANVFPVVQFDASGNLTTEYDQSFPSFVGEPDSNAVDCSTRIAIAPNEFSSPNSIWLTDLSQATYTPGSPGTWSAPTALFSFLSTTSDAAGPCGSAVAPGSQHLAIVTGEFGGSEFQVLKMPSAGGTGGTPPTLADWADVTCVSGFSAGFDPHTVTAYVSPNNGKSYGLQSNWVTGVPSSLLLADLAGILALPRAADGHTVLGETGAGSCLSPTGAVGSTVLTNIPF
jgi:hypothetical protein